jgi:uncharacterized membrane protein
MTNLGTLPGSGSWAVAINNHGQIIGGAITNNAQGYFHAVLWTQR